MISPYFRRRNVWAPHGTSVAGPVAVQIGLVIAYIWALFELRQVPEAQANPTLCVLYAPIEIISTALAWLASRAVDGRMRRGWLLIAIGMGCSALVNLDWVWLSFDSTHRFSWPIYIVAYAQYPLAFWAFASFQRAGSNDVDRTTHLLDAAIVIVAAAVLAWHFLFSEILARSGAGLLATTRALAYTALCLTVLFGAVALFVQRPTRRMVLPLGLLVAAWTILTLANTLQMRATVLKMPLSDMSFNACFAIAALLVTVAAVWFRTHPAVDRRIKDTGTSSGSARFAILYSLLPSAAIAPVFAVLLRQARYATTQPSHQTTAPLTALVLGAIAITLLVVLRQITAQRRNAALQAHFGALVEHASDVVLVVDAAGVIREASPSVAQTLGYHQTTLVGRALADLIALDDQPLVHADFAQITDASTVDGRPRPSALCEWRAMHADGAVRWLEVLCTNLLHDPAVRGVVINGRDVSERKALEIELTHQAYHDALTGLVNQARFRKLVEETLERRRPNGGDTGGTAADLGDRTSVAVLYIDLDEFKPVNDSLGHEAGDRVLEVVTERLLDATRGSDVVARVGGDEFAVLLEYIRDVDEATAVAYRILERIHQPITVASTTVIVGASIGIACTEIDGVLSREKGSAVAATCEVLLRDADEAMYLAKARGGRRYEVYAA
jgi:diguanylate cyclase (GGDEF)-like protein/PAS domain S-box-containing protein